MNIDIRPYYEQMNEAKKYLDSLPKRKKTSAKTEREYMIDTRRMYENKTDPLTASASKNTFYKYRAAWNFMYAKLANGLHKEASAETDKIKKIALINELCDCVAALKRFPPDPSGLNFKRQAQGLYSSAWQTIKDQAPPSKSKKYQVAKLPKNWRERYFNHILAKRSKYAAAIALLALTGCRPSEIENGITLHLQADQSIKVHIEGKKTHDGQYGQAVREFVITDDGPEYAYLVAEMRKNNNQILIQVASANALGEQMRKYGKQVFPKMAGAISPYTYRHAFAKNIKSTLDSKVDIAVAMGHSNDKSQRYYANKGKDGGGFKIEQIEGTREVKQISTNNGFDPDRLHNDGGGMGM